MVLTAWRLFPPQLRHFPDVDSCLAYAVLHVAGFHLMFIEVDVQVLQ